MLTVLGAVEDGGNLAHDLTICAAIHRGKGGGENLAGTPVPARRHVGRRGDELSPLFSGEPRRPWSFCLFEPDGREARGPPGRLRRSSSGTAISPTSAPGQLYGYRVEGPYAPGEGHRFDPAKLLVDPYAKAIAAPFRWDDALLGYDPADPDGAPSRRTARPGCRDASSVESPSAGRRPASADAVEPAPSSTRRTARGLTMRHPRIPRELRGTYLGLAMDPVLDHLLALGSRPSSSCRAPRVASAASSRPGSRTTGTTTRSASSPPSRRFATDALGGQVTEFKTMVKRLHHAGIEVILDVVYNHTGRGQSPRPTLAFRGIDNASYYRLDPNDPRAYVDFTGCGNTLNMLHPRTIQLIMDSLRYWVLEMHVDGSASTSRRRSRASSTRWSASGPSSTSSTRTRCSRR
jgi:glycogen operon protein